LATFCLSKGCQIQLIDAPGEEPEAVSAKRIVKRGDEEIIEAQLS